jgi:hypothetical protein
VERPPPPHTPPPLRSPRVTGTQMRRAACHVAAHATRWAVREVAAGRLSCEHPDAVALASAALAVSDALAAAGCVASAVDAVLGQPLHDFWTSDSRQSPRRPPLSSPVNTEANAALSDRASELPPVFDLLYVAESSFPHGVEATVAIPALPQCMTVAPTSENLATRCSGNKASARRHAIAASAFLVTALHEREDVARGATAAATRAFKRAESEDARARGETDSAGRHNAAADCIREPLSWFCCFAPAGFDDTDKLNAIVRAAPGGASADALLAHCLSSRAHPEGPRDILLLCAGALTYISAPETSAAALTSATGALVGAVMAHPELFRAYGEAGRNACVGLVLVLRIALSWLADDAMICGSALEALVLLSTLVHVEPLSASVRLGALAADAMLQHAPFMAVQAAGSAVLTNLLLSDGEVSSTTQLSAVALLSKVRAEWVRDGTLARASTALLLALRRSAVAAAKAERQGQPTPPPVERVLTCAPAALASALRIACADDAAGSGSSRFEEIQSVLHAVLDACSSLETMSSDEVMATADASMLPALTEMLSSRMWWEQSGAAGFNSPESTAQLLTAVANAKERTDRRNAIAAARSASHTAAPPESAPPHKAPPLGDADQTTRDLIDSLLAAQVDMAARLHAMEDGMARASESAERRI